MAEVEIVYDDDESFSVYAKGIRVAGFNHEQHGWSGMTAARDLVRSLARELYLSIDETGDENV